jgi:hypothetical protein
LRKPNITLYAALANAGHCDSAPAGERAQDMEDLAAHHKQLQVWAANCPENFENRAALVGAEIARLEGRDVDAVRFAITRLATADGAANRRLSVESKSS